MNKILLLLCILFSICGCGKDLSEYDLLHRSNPIGNYGAKISLSQFDEVYDLIHEPKLYLDKKVLVNGKILEVCPMRGCWITLKDKSSEISIRVKVTDGEIVFPLSAKGYEVDVEGVFVKLEFSEDQARQWKVHLAEEKGIILNPNDVVLNPSDLIEYRIIGSSANIYSLNE